MLDWVADRIAVLVHDEGVRPGEIAVVAPFVSGGLRFSLENRLASPRRGGPVAPAFARLREEPTHALPADVGGAVPSGAGASGPPPFDVAHALMLTIADMDLVRAQLLAEIAYRTRDGVPGAHFVRRDRAGDAGADHLPARRAL